jgi:hypothetical protein
MPKEIFFEILNKQLFFQLGLIIVLYFLNSFVVIQLALRLNSTKFHIKTLLPFIIGLVIYALLGKQFLPIPIYGLILIIVIASILYFIGKIKFFKALFTSFSVILLGGLGELIILQPLTLYKKNIMLPLMKTPLGIACGTLVEITIPAILLFSFMIFKIPSQNNKNKTSMSDIMGVILFAIMFFPIYYLVILFLWIRQNVPDSTIMIVLVIEVILFLLAGIVFIYISKSKHKEELEETQIKTQLDQSYRLIETLFSERREYRNQLQVMNLMATAGHNKEINDYICHVVENMATASISKIKNPILASTIIARQVQAKEKGVAIILQCNTTLDNLSFNPVKLGEIFEILLDILMENELVVKSPALMIFLFMTETEAMYFFEFKNSEAVISSFKNTAENVLNPHLQLAAESSKLGDIKNLIQAIGGDPTYAIEDNHLVRIQFSIKKSKSKGS